MKQNMRLLDHITAAAELSDEALPGLPLVEIAGDKRVLIEHHKGVLQYAQHKISVRASYGRICISGQNLQLLKMTKDQLLITGCIDAVELMREEG